MIAVERIKEAMRRASLSQAELARRAGVSAAAIQQIVNGKTKRSRALPEIAESLAVSPEWLEGKVDSPSRLMVDTYSVADTDLVALPYVYRGYNPYFPDTPETGVKQFKFSKKWLQKVTGSKLEGGLYVSKVNSAAMVPTLMVGDEVFVLPLTEFDKDADSIWLCSVHEQNFLRRVRLVSDTRVLLLADNETLPAFECDLAELEFFGKVIWYGRRLVVA